MEDVISGLGPPISEAGAEARKELNYGIWQLSFANERLVRRSRVLVPSGAKAIPESTDLTRRVLDLHLGIAVEMVEKQLGIPEIIYEVFERSPIPIRTLRYGSWELTFRNDRLYERAQ
jgi:hypothetical protein